MRKIFEVLSVIVAVTAVTLGLNSFVFAAAPVKLMILPDDEKVQVGQTVKVRVYMKSPDLVNLVSANIVFDSSVFNLVKIDKSRTITNLWLFEPKMAPANISFGGAMIYPGFDGEGEIFSFDLKAKVATTTSVITINQAQTFASDGIGSAMNSSISSFKLKVVKGNSATAGFAKFAIRSNTHQEGKWSNKNQAAFYWPEGYESAMSFNTKAKSNPGKSNKRQTTASFNAPKDGVYYFHLNAKDKAGAYKLYHYKVMIDTKKPANFSASFSSPKKVGDTLKITMKSKDALSGTAYYNVIIDGKGKKVTGTTFTKVFKQRGSYRVAVRAVDKAGNYAETIKTFIIN